MTRNEQIVRKGYEIAEKQDGSVATYTPDGEFNNEALAVLYRGRLIAAFSRGPCGVAARTGTQ